MFLGIHFNAVLEYWEWFLSGAGITLQISLIATVFGLIIGIVGAIGRRSEIYAVRKISGCYVEIIRNTPLLVQLFVAYFGLSAIGFQLSAFFVAACAVTVNNGAYITEIVRAGFDAVGL